MTYSIKLQVKRLSSDATLPNNKEWNDFRQSMIDSGKIKKYEVSDFSSEGIATIDYIFDDEKSWQEVKDKSANIGDWHKQYEVTLVK